MQPADIWSSVRNPNGSSARFVQGGAQGCGCAPRAAAGPCVPGQRAEFCCRLGRGAAAAAHPRQQRRHQLRQGGVHAGRGWHHSAGPQSVTASQAALCLAVLRPQYRPSHVLWCMVWVEQVSAGLRSACCDPCRLQKWGLIGFWLSAACNIHHCLLQINYLGPYTLTRCLERTLQRSAPSRVVNVSSVMHRFASLRNARDALFVWKRGAGDYSVSKLDNVLFTYELQRRLGKHGVQARCHAGRLCSANTRCRCSPDMRALREHATQ